MMSSADTYSETKSVGRSKKAMNRPFRQEGRGCYSATDSWYQELMGAHNVTFVMFKRKIQTAKQI